MREPKLRVLCASVRDSSWGLSVFLCVFAPLREILFSPELPQEPLP